MLHDEMVLEEITHEHSKMVAKIAKILAVKSNFTSSEVDTIEIAALLHDIGKQYVPMQILQKPSELSEDEYNTIKTHVTSGYEHIIYMVKLLLIAAIISLQHHERVDGKGYFEITNIHSYAKLVAVADVFDALISKRPYKDAWTSKEACDYLIENAHKHFEADYVTALIESLDEIIALYNQGQCKI